MHLKIKKGTHISRVISVFQNQHLKIGSYSHQIVLTGTWVIWPHTSSELIKQYKSQTLSEIFSITSFSMKPSLERNVKPLIS